MDKSRFTDTVLMIRPRHFGFNEETAMNNRFQRNVGDRDKTQISEQALLEFEGMAETLRSAGIRVEIGEDTDDPVKPDAVFPNNWVTFHRDGSIMTYPMFSQKRRAERREDILHDIAERYRLDKRYSLEFYEKEGMFLEGTGSMVLDRKEQWVYAALGPRTNVKVLDKFCLLKGYEKVIFHARDRANEDIYHTNVMMALGAGFAIVCLESIRDKEELKRIKQKLGQSELELIDITFDQMEAFAGNMLQLIDREGEAVLVLSSRALHALKQDQKNRIRTHTKMIHCPLETIETYGGGSARCMLAEIFYPIPPQ